MNIVVLTKLDRSVGQGTDLEKGLRPIDVGIDTNRLIGWLNYFFFFFMIYLIELDKTVKSIVPIKSIDSIGPTNQWHNQFGQQFGSETQIRPVG